MKYTVNVGNIGNIEFTNKKKATEAYNEYVRQSKTNYGRAAGEPVYLLDTETGDSIKEYPGTIDQDEED